MQNSIINFSFGATATLPTLGGGGWMWFGGAKAPHGVVIPGISL